MPIPPRSTIGSGKGFAVLAWAISSPSVEPRWRTEQIRGIGSCTSTYSSAMWKGRTSRGFAPLGQTATSELPFGFHPSSIQPDRSDTCLLYTSDAADDLLCVDLG